MSDGASTSDTQPHLRRVLGLWDLVLLGIVAVFNLNLVPPVAAGGYPSISLWMIGLLFFFLPQGIAVAEFATRYPEEGGIYLWTKKAFGEFHGFLSGWCYWTTNVFYIPTLLVYLVGILIFEAGPRVGTFGESAGFQIVLSMGFLWLFTLASIRGLGVNKWMNNLGGVAAIVTTVVLVIVGILVFRRHGAVTFPGVSGLVPTLAGWRTMSALGVICLGLVGLELGSVMGDEIRDPRRNVPRAALLGGLACGVLYLSATLTLLLALPVKEISVVTGVLQAFGAMGARVGLSWLHLAVAVILGISICGATSAWLSGGARVPFVAGLDRYLPAAFSRLHPRWQTPHVALIAQAVAASFAIVLSFLGTNVKVREAYNTLLALTVFTQLVPFVYLYGGLMRVAGTPGGLYRRRLSLWLAGLLGLAATLAALATAFVPPAEIKFIWRFEIKLFIGLGLLIGVAAAWFRWFAMRKPAFQRGSNYAGAKAAEGK